MRKGILFLILCSMLLATEPVLAKDPILVKTGYKYIKKGYISKALPTFKRAVIKYPDNANAHYGLALAAEKQGGDDNLKIAIIHFRKAIELDPNNLDAMKKLARILSWNTDTRAESLHLYRRALALDPNNDELKYQLAEILTWEGNSYEALELFEPLYKKDPGNMDLAIKYANALASSGRYYESVDLYRKAIKAKVPFDKYTAHNYARALAKTNHPEASIQIYNDVIKMSDSPEEISNLKNELASALFDSGHYEEAINVDTSIETKTKDVLLRLARANDKLANKKEAVSIFEEAYNLYPYDIEVQRSAALYLSQIGGYDITASKIFEKLIEDGYGTLDDKISLAYIYNKNDATRDKAITLFKNILQDPNIDESKADEIRISLAKSLASSESTRPEAVQLYRQIIAAHPDDKDLLYDFLELLSWQDSTRHEALVKYFELIQENPNSPTLQNKFNETLSWYLPNEGDLDLYEQILTKYPDNVNAVKGMAYLASQYTDDVDRALELYKKVLSFSPDNLDVQMQVANLLASKAETRKDAIEWLKKINDKSPDNVEVLSLLGNNLLYTKKFKEAKKYYQKVLALQPDNKDALLGTARIYGWQGLNLAAYKAYTKAYKSYPYDADIAYEYANIAKKLGKNGKALEILKTIKGQSMLPDAPDLPELAMAVEYQVLSVDSNNANPMASNTNIDKLQNDLDDIQKSLQELEKQLSGLQKSNKEFENTHNMVLQSQPVKEPVDTATSEIYTDLSDSYKVDTISPFMLQKETLPEPVIPKGPIQQTITYSEGSPYDLPAVQQHDSNFDEIVYNSGENQSPIHFRVTGFEDALAGRRYSLMHELFGDIEKDILYNMRPEIRTSFILSNEAGDPTSDGMEVHGYPTFVSVNLTPQNRFRFGITSATYGMTPRVHPASITMTSYTLGLNSRPHERVNFDGELTISSISDPQAPVDVMGKARLELKLHDRLRMKLGYRREPLYQSVFGTTGYTVQPQYSTNQLLNIFQLTSDPRFVPDNTVNAALLAANPNYYNALRGRFMGKVRDNAVNAELTWIPFNKWDVNAGYEYSAVRGKGILANGRHQAMFSVGRTFTGVKNHLFRLGYQFLFFGYRRDLSAFPNMTAYPYMENGQYIPVSRQMSYAEARNLAAARYASPNDIFNDPTGATVTRFISPVDFIRAPRGVGIGGYFSPTQFYLNSFRFDFEGKILKGRLYYKGGASLGVQQIGDRVSRMDLLAARGLQNFANIPANDPRRNFPAFNANANAADQIRDNTDPTSLAAAFDLTMFLKLTDFMTIYSGVDYLNTGAFDRWRYNGGLILRPNIKALTPIFRKPKAVDPEAEVESDEDVNE